MPTTRPVLTDDGDLMSDDDVSLTDTPSESVELSAFDKQSESLQTYVNSLPYECESLEQMQAKLLYIVDKICICAKTRNWLVLTTWDGMLQCWLLMRYPIQKATRAKLVRLYYELSLMPGVEPRVIRSWTEMLSRLLANKPGSKRKLESQDLQLPWQPLWRAVQKELWPKQRIQDSTRNVVNILLFVAEKSKGYYSVTEIPSMLGTFLPLLTKETFLTMVPVLTSFLPPSHTHLYLPMLFKVWEAFNSSVMDDRLLDLAGSLAEEHVAGPNGEEPGGAEWKDVGIWTQNEWNVLMGKGLGSMNVPVGATQGASTTATQADSMAVKSSLRIKKTVNRFHSLAKIIVYSLAVDGDIRENNRQGYLAGSKALDSLDRLITSTESFFHPSNSGVWTATLTAFLTRLTSEFIKRHREEEQESCKVPVSYRLTPAIRRSFVAILRTPALLAMFSKDPTSASYAQSALRTMAMLEPNIIMPELLERAYGGLEVINETHRTTAVLNMLSGVPLPLVSERIWLGGQKHIVPLLELCVPGIDLNDPTKTLCATSFIVSVVQHLKIGDLTKFESGISSPSDDENFIDTVQDKAQLDTPKLSKVEERLLVRDSTAGFADWVTSLVRRILALYENLPEEGGRRNTTGGKQEENVLKSIKAMMDVVCLHLSDELFDLVLNLLYAYATTNAKANAVQAIGQLISCLARVKPDLTMAKFLPFCTSQIEEELKHGASSLRTTSSHVAIPSDIALHWNISILRGCLGFGGAVLLKYKRQILDLMLLLVEKTKSERGYTSAGRLITRVLHTIAETYPLNSRFVNTDEWDDEHFKRDHNAEWGRLYNPEDVIIEWHVPTTEEIEFALEILDQVFEPALDKVEALLETTSRWDSIARNEFCRFLHACRATWGGLTTFYQEAPKEVANPCLSDTEVPELIVSFLDVKAGFTLTDLDDPRHYKTARHKKRFGEVCRRAASVLRENSEGEDHIDAVLGVTRAIDTFMVGYAINRGDFESLQKNYIQARDANRYWPRQRENSRLVFLKRAHVYHSGRVYMHALYRPRSALDDQVLSELVELSLSPYTRIRRQAQAVLHSICGYYDHSTRLVLPALFHALKKGSEPDRMKGALYVLWNKGITAYALGDPEFHNQYLLSLLGCQHEEKPSVQKLVNSLSQDCLVHLTEEAVHTDAYMLDTPAVEHAVQDLELEFPLGVARQRLSERDKDKAQNRLAKRSTIYRETVLSILEVASRSTTHWRYVQIALRFIFGLLRRDISTPPEVAEFLLEQSTSPQPTIRSIVQKTVVKLLAFVKIRTYSISREELWREEWSNPLREEIKILDPEIFLRNLALSVDTSNQAPYVDKMRTGFLAWAPTIKGYRSPGDLSAIIWESGSQPSLNVIREVVAKPDYFQNLALLWSQESGKLSGAIDLRKENIVYIKSIVKVFEQEGLETILAAIHASLSDADKFSQRAAAELLAGVLRGSKHWPRPWLNHVWTWTANRLDTILTSIKPDTLPLWESFFHYLLRDRDPRRNQPLVDWILALPLEFNGESAFAMSKSVSIFGLLVDGLGMRFKSQGESYIQLFFDNANTGYAELRGHLCQILLALTKHQWQPAYPTSSAFLAACSNSDDPLHIRNADHSARVLGILEKLDKWRDSRLPPPRVIQSEYDKIGMTILMWIWVSSHGPQASLMFPYIIPMMPEILRMSELNDNSELQMYSTAVLYVLSAVSAPREYVAAVLENFATAIKSSKSWRIRLNALPPMVVFFYRNLLSISQIGVSQVMDVLLDCLGDDNVEVQEMASKVFAGVVRCSQRQSIVQLKNRFTKLIQNVTLPPRRDPSYAESMRSLHSGILGLCALIESLPYSVEPWMPPLTEILAPHAADPPPISTTIRKCASEFKKTHQDNWHKDELMFNEDQLQSLSTMLVGTSYYA